MPLASYSKYAISSFSIFLALALFASPGKADIMYTYTGNPTTNWTGSTQCPKECVVTGSFIVAAPLPAGSSGYLFGSTLPISFTFKTGDSVFTNLNTSKSDFGFITDEKGNIIGWNVDFFSGGYALYISSGPSWVCTAGCSVTDIRNGNGSSSFNRNSPGVWVDPPIDGTSVPEPSTIVLLATGLIALTLLVKSAA